LISPFFVVETFSLNIYTASPNYL